ncbi:MAG TPA: Ig-like domain-containing protein, partial [Candidatus Acidoferrum sp.]|nr:Ig-like domain-containing protein [Candidatus Acidoferrum sp.]
ADILDQTNATLVLSNLTVGSIGNYRVVVSNSFGSVTSLVAVVESGIGFAELFNTGVDDSGNFLSGGQVDAHYKLISSADPSFPGPDVLVMNNGVYPLAGDYFTNGLFSSWISPRTNSAAGNSNGVFVYQTSFIIDSADPAHAQIDGNWASDNEALDIRLNGVSLGISNMVSAAFRNFYPFVVTNGFVQGLNSIEFVISNGPASGPTGLRVEMRGVGRSLPPGLPQILNQPTVAPILQEGQDVTLAVVAVGSAPLTYQWYAGEIEWELDLPGATSRTLTFDNISQIDQDGSKYWVRVTNPQGFSNSIPVTFSVNAQPVANDDFIASGTNLPVTFAVSKLLFNDSDPDFDAISFFSISSGSANGGSVTILAGQITYTPVATFTGTDSFTYVLADARGGRDTGTIWVNVGATNFLSIATPPVLLPDGHFQIGYSGVPGYPYTIERATNVLGPWQVFTNIAADGTGLFSIDDPNTPPEPMRFYRTRYP